MFQEASINDHHICIILQEIIELFYMYKLTYKKEINEL